MRTLIMCSWCHELSQTRYCQTCGHRADLARAGCDCSRCKKTPDEPDVMGDASRVVQS